MKEYTYAVVLEREGDGGYHAFCPGLPGCHTVGDTADDALENVRDAIKLYVESVEAHGEAIPEAEVTVVPVRIAL